MEQVCKVSIYHSTKTQHSHMLWWCTWCPSVATPLVNVKSSWWMNEDEQYARNSTSTNLILRLLLNKLCPARAQCTNVSSFFGDVLTTSVSDHTFVLRNRFHYFFSILIEIRWEFYWCASSAQQAVKISGSSLHKDNTGCAFELQEPGQLPCLNKQHIASKLREKVFWSVRYQ